MDEDDRESIISGKDADFMSLSRFTVYFSAQELDNVSNSCDEPVIFLACVLIDNDIKIFDVNI